MSLGLTDELLSSAPASPVATDAPNRDIPQNVGKGSLTDELLAGPTLSSGSGKSLMPADALDDPKRAVPLFTVLKASIFPDDNKKLDFLSQETGIPRENWGVSDGNIIFKEPQSNQWIRAIPSVSKAKNAIDLWQRATKWAADQVGPSAPGVAGGAVGVAMGPTPGSIPAATATAGAVDAGRQAIGNLMLDNDTPVGDIDWMNSLGQGLLGGVGQAVPTAFMRGPGGALTGASRNPMKVSPYDRKAALDPATLTSAQGRTAEAQAQGIPLTFGQSTGLRSGLSAERQLARDPAAMDTMDRFYTGQREKVGDAVRGFADSISPVQSVDGGVNAMRQGAEESVNQARAARAQVADPLYEAARASDAQVDVAPILADIDGRLSVAKGPIKDALSKARELLVMEGPEGKMVPETRVEALHQVKIALDAMMEARGENAVGNTAKRELMGVQNSLLDTLDNSVPEYAAARQAFRAASPAVDELTDGVVGKLATTEGDARIGEIRQLFNANLTNPAAVNKARVAYEKSGRLDDWNAGVATWLKDALDGATKTNKGGVVSARDLVSTVYRDDNQKKLLKAALSPEQFDGLTRLMNVIQDVAQTLPEGSATATDMAGGQALRQQFGRPVAWAKGLLNMQMGDALLDRATLRLSDSGMAKLAEAVTNPNNVEQLKKLRMMDPRSEKALIAASQLMGVPVVTGSSGARDARGKPPQSPQAE